MGTLILHWTAMMMKMSSGHCSPRQRCRSCWSHNTAGGSLGLKRGRHRTFFWKSLIWQLENILHTFGNSFIEEKQSPAKGIWALVCRSGGKGWLWESSVAIIVIIYATVMIIDAHPWSLMIINDHQWCPPTSPSLRQNQILQFQCQRLRVPSCGWSPRPRSHCDHHCDDD